MLFLNGKKWSFRISIATLMILLTLALSAAFLFIARNTFNRAAEQSSDRLFAEIASKLVEQVDGLLGSVEAVTEAGAFLANAATSADQLSAQDGLLLFMINTLKQNARLHALFWEDRQGTLVRVVSVRANPALREWYAAADQVAYVARLFDQSGQVRAELHFDQAAREVARSAPALKQSTVPRPWHDKQGQDRPTLFHGPYVLGGEPLAGITCTTTAADGLWFGADIALVHLADFLWDQSVSRFGYVFMFDRDGSLLAHPREPSVSVIRRGSGEEMWFTPLGSSLFAVDREIWATFHQRGADTFGAALQLRVESAAHIVRLAPVAHPGLDLIIAVTAPLSDFTSAFSLIRHQVAVVSLLAILLALAASYVLAGRMSHALSLLAASARRVQQFDFSAQERLQSVFLEIHTLIESFALMRTTIRQRTDELLVTQGHLKNLVDTGIALSGEPDDQRLVDLTFDAARQLALADGGLLYRGDEQSRLRVVRMQRASRGLALVRLADSDSRTFDLHDGGNGLAALAAKAVASGTITTMTGYAGPGLVPELDADFGPFHSVLFVPLKTRREKVVGLLQLVTAADAPHEEAVFARERHPFVEVLASQAANALDNHDLVAAHRRLMDSFIKVIAGAVDAKSPHTGRHCSRVPELALLLAREAHAASHGPLEAFRLDGDNAWREFEIAAWLHDCGKLTTPDMVVNKATKLECQYNRIHEIRMRFEVLRRDVEISHLRALAGDRLEEPDVHESIAQDCLRLDDDFAFLARCNLGRERLDQAERERILTLAGRTWNSRFDPTLGLAEEEAARIADPWRPGRIEPLLADRPEHLLPFDPGNTHDALAQKFNLRPPLYRFNHGELHNLLVVRGTLTEEERFAIQDHSIQTIRMLERLPFPEYLARVPEYACNHHEKCNGTGYPRGLKCEQMSVPARILAIADIFEALTAADRPYKAPMGVTEALAIMQAMCERGEIDPALFALFAHSGVIERYGHDYLLPAQMNRRASAGAAAGSPA